MGELVGDLLVRADATALSRFGVMLTFGVCTAGAVRGVAAGIAAARPFLLLGCWLVAMAAATATIVSFPAFVAGWHPLVSLGAIGAFVRAHDLPLAALLAVGTLATVAVEFTRSAPQSAAAEARAGAVGAAGEGLVALALRQAGYPALHNVLLRGRGWSAEIDHVVRTPGAIVAIETKTLAGRVEGRPEDGKWVQRVGGRERWFLNPLRQNATHLEVLRRTIGTIDAPLRGLVVVAGSAVICEGLCASVVPLAALGDVLAQDVGPGARGIDRAWAILERAAERGGDRRAHAAYVWRRRQRG